MKSTKKGKNFEIYNFQDTTIVENFENRANEIMKRFPYNLSKCTSASLLSGCIHCYFLQIIITLPTQSDFVGLFEKTLIGSFCCINTRLAFDKTISFPRHLKIIYKVRNSKANELENKRIVSKVLKMDENSQYGNARTKCLLSDSIRK